MADSEERAEIHDDEGEQWEEPQLDVTSLKEAMSGSQPSPNDGVVNYS